MTRIGYPARTLVINADDLGFTDGVTRGILEAHHAGAVTSASLMMNTPGTANAIAAALQTPSLGVGLHLNLSVGVPLSPREHVRSLVDEETGRLLPLRRLVARALRGALSKEELRREIHAQFAMAIDCGVALTHVDGHQHVHLLPGIFPIVLDAARHFGVARVRRPTEPLHHRFWSARATMVKLSLHLSYRFNRVVRPEASEHGRGVSLQGAKSFHRRLIDDIRSLPLGTTELVVHPGYADAELAAMDDYLAPRDLEREALSSGDVIALLERCRIQPANFATVSQNTRHPTAWRTRQKSSRPL